MRITLSSVYVDDQDKALKFYTEILGFMKKEEIPAIEWLTVVSPDEPDGTQLLLEPDAHPAAQTFKKAIVADGIPVTSFVVEDVQHEYDRMTRLGVVFRMPPTRMGAITIAVFEDTCGNLIQIAQE
jgi:catechol 2,3-dioxygenase-like lactoylglutathione lyase family enzyme